MKKTDVHFGSFECPTKTNETITENNDGTTTVKMSTVLFVIIFYPGTMKLQTVLY